MLPVDRKRDALLIIDLQPDFMPGGRLPGRFWRCNRAENRGAYGLCGLDQGSAMKTCLRASEDLFDS